MTPDFNDEKMLRTRFRQETFSVIICNIALLTVILSPGGDFSMTARIGFALGLVLLDAIYAVMRVRFRGNPNALKENRTYRTLYYVSWIMVGIAILLVIFHSLGYFRKKVSFSLIRLDFSAEAAEGFDAPAHGADEAWASQLKLVESPEALSEILHMVDPSGENTAAAVSEYESAFFEKNLIGCALLSTGHTAGRIAADSAEDSDAGKNALQIKIFFYPSGVEEGETYDYLFFAEIPRDLAEKYDSYPVSVETQS